MEWLGVAGDRDRWRALSGGVWLRTGTGGGYGVVGSGWA